MNVCTDDVIQGSRRQKFQLYALPAALCACHPRKLQYKRQTNFIIMIVAAYSIQRLALLAQWCDLKSPLATLPSTGYSAINRMMGYVRWRVRMRQQSASHACMNIGTGFLPLCTCYWSWTRQRSASIKGNVAGKGVFGSDNGHLIGSKSASASGYQGLATSCGQRAAIIIIGLFGIVVFHKRTQLNPGHWTPMCPRQHREWGGGKGGQAIAYSIHRIVNWLSKNLNLKWHRFDYMHWLLAENGHCAWHGYNKRANPEVVAHWRW